MDQASIELKFLHCGVEIGKVVRERLCRFSHLGEPMLRVIVLEPEQATLAGLIEVCPAKAGPKSYLLNTPGNLAIQKHSVCSLALNSVGMSKHIPLLPV